jgi:hypothetical protein
VKIMSSKAITLAAVSMSALVLYATEASAQATPFYNSPVQTRTYDDGAGWSRPSIGSSRRTVVRPRGVDAFATAPGPRVQWSAPVDNVHPSISDY